MRHKVTGMTEAHTSQGMSETRMEGGTATAKESGWRGWSGIVVFAEFHHPHASCVLHGGESDRAISEATGGNARGLERVASEATGGNARGFERVTSESAGSAGEFDPVTFELIGKARELADKTGQEVVCVALGSGVTGPASQLLRYPVDRVLVYDRPELRHYVAGVYAAFFQDAILIEKPSIVLMGATPVGRSLAPRIAVRFRTGLTADCTVLDIRPNGDLVQTRPAFGGNIMATILTRNARPQMATVRYKVMPRAERREERAGEDLCEVVEREISRPEAVKSLCRHIRSVLTVSEHRVPRADSISDAKVIVAVGRGVKCESDLEMFGALAERLGGMLGGSRPLVERGWLPVSRQVGQSGRTVRPDVYLALGISGAIQHVAGISGGTVIAVNNDKTAPIFRFANYGIVGDVYAVVPALLKML